MGVNLDKPKRWKRDIAQSVDLFNDWFMNFAPLAFRETRMQTTKDVLAALRVTRNLLKIQPAILRKHPEILPTLRMSTCPPLAVDRLIGLAGIPKSMVKRMEREKKLPVRMAPGEIDRELAKISAIIEKMADPDIFSWLGRKKAPTKTEINRAATIVADRLCGAVANPIIRNAQEKRQLATIKDWLESRGYTKLPQGDSIRFDAMPKGSFSFRMNVPVELEGAGKTVNIPVDVVIMRKRSRGADLPLFLEAKSAGNFTNTNKRRKRGGDENGAAAEYLREKNSIHPISLRIF